MNKSEFNSFSFLEMENEILRKKVKDLEHKLKLAEAKVNARELTINTLVKTIKLKDGNERKELQ